MTLPPTNSGPVQAPQFGIRSVRQDFGRFILNKKEALIGGAEPKKPCQQDLFPEELGDSLKLVKQYKRNESIAKHALPISLGGAGLMGMLAQLIPGVGPLTTAVVWFFGSKMIETGISETAKETSKDLAEKLVGPHTTKLAPAVPPELEDGQVPEHTQNAWKALNSRLYEKRLVTVSSLLEQEEELKHVVMAHQDSTEKPQTSLLSKLKLHG